MANIAVKMKGLKASKRAIVDDELFEELNKSKWYEDKDGYAKSARYGGKELDRHITLSTRMHRLITGAKKGQLVDHINGNPLDNRRVNLRICNNTQNQANQALPSKRSRSGFRGVSQKRKTAVQFGPTRW